MYVAIVVLTMFALPVGSVLVEHLLRPDAPWLYLIGRWFVVWGVGARLGLAGLRQVAQPAFTARQIFHIEGDDALPIVRELGVANLAAGVVALASLAVSTFVLPAALWAAIFYGAAGLSHVRQKARSANESLAMASDLFMAVVLAIVVVYGVAHLVHMS